MKNCGFSQDLALQIEARYHELYKVSDAWVAAKLDQAARDGFATVAFGLRVRTPLLAQVIRGNRATPREAEAEGRSVGNAFGQSYCLLNSRAASEFLDQVRDSDYHLEIRPCAQIHDAQYYLVRDDIAVVDYVNQRLVRAVQWQDDPAIWHDQVKLGGEVSIFWPTWADEIVIPNGADQHTIRAVVADELTKRTKEKRA
jgi:DNA polymerase-1